MLSSTVPLEAGKHVRSSIVRFWLFRLMAAQEAMKLNFPIGAT